MIFILIVLFIAMIYYIYLMKREGIIFSKIPISKIRFFVLIGSSICISILLIVHLIEYNRNISGIIYSDAELKLLVKFDRILIDKVPQITLNKFQVIITSPDGEVTVSTFIDSQELIRLERNIKRLIDTYDIEKK